MNTADWMVMCAFLAFVVIYGIWKTRRQKGIENYLLAGRSTPWYTVALSVMATQASAITFLSTPGQAYVDGMRFVQFYLGLPIAMIILCQTAVPIYHRLRVYTAYEYLEQRFDLKNRLLGSFLFLIQRGLAAGFTIFAPALVLSMLLGWDIRLTVIAIGLLVVLYTVIGGSRAVNQTHLLQMIIIGFGMFTSFFLIVKALPADISLFDATAIAGKMGKMNVITFDFDWRDRYTFWSGLLGGTFLALSYFGTDQSQVSRYLSGKSVTQSRIGLLANGLFKIPMQFGILFLGIMVFVYYQFVAPPLFFNSAEVTHIKAGEQAPVYLQLEDRFSLLHEQKQVVIRQLISARRAENSTALERSSSQLQALHMKENDLREEAFALIRTSRPGADGHDTNYIFLHFVIAVMPAGLIGLVLAAILSASMSSTSAELNALASTTVIDIYKRVIKPNRSEAHYLRVSKLATFLWGLYAIGFALFANRLGSLIEAVNILGSLFYGTILGLFLLAFYFRRIGGHAAFISALFAEVLVLICFFFSDIPYLWYNVIASVLMVALAHGLQWIIGRRSPVKAA